MLKIISLLKTKTMRNNNTKCNLVLVIDKLALKYKVHNFKTKLIFI